VIIIYYSEREFVACDPSDEERVKREFFKGREIGRFTRVAVGDYAYVRAAAATFPTSAGPIGGVAYGSPTLHVTTNPSDK
jgi:hypothetical protein